MKRNATIKDIAEELGISATAVSRALRNMPDISGETREKVIAAAERLNYSKNYAASSLRTNSTNIIGLIIDILNPICIGMYKGVEDIPYSSPPQTRGERTSAQPSRQCTQDRSTA